MMHLAETFPALGMCDTAIITGGGMSLRKYWDKILASLYDDRRHILFDVNGYLAWLARELDQWKRFAQSPAYKFMVSLDFALLKPGHYRELPRDLPGRDRIIEGADPGAQLQAVRQFITCRNGYFIFRAHPQTKEPLADVMERCIPMEALVSTKDWESRANTSFALKTVQAAMGCVPIRVRRMVLFGCDTITCGDYRNIKGYTSSRDTMERAATVIKEAIRYFGEERNVEIILKR